MRLVWTERSRAHLTALHDHIAAEDPAAATRVATRIVDLVGTLLREHPRSGRPGRVAGTRELVITGTPYLVAYEANPTEWGRETRHRSQREKGERGASSPQTPHLP